MTSRRVNQAMMADALANSLHVLDRLATLTDYEVQEAADTYAVRANIARKRQFEEMVLRRLRALRSGKGSWSDRRQRKEAGA